MQFHAKRRVLASALILGSSLIAMQAHAQDTTESAPSATQPADETADVVFTGSRIARPELQASVPIQSVSLERIQQTGAANIQDVLATLPQVGQNFSRTSRPFISSSA